MNIPPVVGLVISLSLGVVIGGFGCHMWNEKNQAEADADQIKDDNKTAAKIDVETIEAKRDNVVSKEIIKWKNKPPVQIPRELTADEIHSICNNYYLPVNVMQSIRIEATKARDRINDVQDNNAPGR